MLLFCLHIQNMHWKNDYEFVRHLVLLPFFEDRSMKRPMKWFIHSFPAERGLLFCILFGRFFIQEFFKGIFSSSLFIVKD